MKIKYLGHSSFWIEMTGVKIIVDPFISANPKASHIDINSLEADFILLTHGHLDHVLDVENIALANSAKIVANYEIATHYEEKEVQSIGMNHGGTVDLGGVSAKMVQAVHTSSFQDGSYAGQPAGFVLFDESHSLYISGDTALTMDMKLIPMTCPPLTAAVLCIGDHFTMGYKDAFIAAEFVETQKVIGCHYDTFGPIEIVHEEAIAYFENKEKQLILPEIGSTIEL